MLLLLQTLLTLCNVCLCLYFKQLVEEGDGNLHTPPLIQDKSIKVGVCLESKNSSVIRQKIRTWAYQGVRNIHFFGKFGVLCFLVTSVLRYTLLPYYWRILLKIAHLDKCWLEIDFDSTSEKKNDNMIQLLITPLIVIKIAPLTQLFFNCLLLYNCPLLKDISFNTMFVSLVWLTSNHILGFDNFWDKSPAWFLKTLKLPSFYSGHFKTSKNALGNLSQIALSNMWLLAQVSTGLLIASLNLIYNFRGIYGALPNISKSLTA